MESRSSIVDRETSRDLLNTGVLSLAAYASVSRGQRQLTVGNNKVGKTTLLSTLCSNLTVNSTYTLMTTPFIFSFYNFIGSSRREFIYNKKVHSTLNKWYSSFIDGTVSNSIYVQFYSPFNTLEVCEVLSFEGLNTVQVLDSLGNHAKVYRNLMLDLKRAPGREAYPGDIFYLHSNLLERFGQFNYSFNLGSITGLPVVEVSGDNITDYITTNLISITDGQWFLSSLLKVKGLYPCLDTRLSVSRLGNSSQKLVMRKLLLVLKSCISRFYILEDLKKSSVLSTIENLLWLRLKSFRCLMFNSGLRCYVSLVLSLLINFFIKNISYCNDLTCNTKVLIYLSNNLVSTLGLLVLWGYYSSSSYYLTTVLNVFVNLIK